MLNVDLNNINAEHNVTDVDVNLEAPQSSHYLKRKFHSASYPSGKELFCNFEEEDTDISYLNDESRPQSKDVPSFTHNAIRSPNKKRSTQCKARRAVVSSSLSTKIKALEVKVKQLQRCLKKERNRSNRLRKKLEKQIQNKMSSIDDFLATKDIHPTARTMINLQLHKKKTQYTSDEKDLSKQIYFHSAACYTRLRNAGLNLPSESTVRAWVSENDVRPGLNINILEKIGKYLMSLPSNERICALKFDEMSIKAFEEYSKKYDLVEGLVDMGKERRSREVAKHGLLFQLDSINVKNSWRQLVWFGFNENGASAEELYEIVPEIIKELRKVGADVRMIVCDQGANNQKLFKLLNVTCKQPFFFIGDLKCFAAFDWPHLIKRLVAQLRSHRRININDEIVVSFEDLLRTWELDNSHGTSNLLGHLTSSHFYPNNFEVMKVKLAFQLLSRRMACAIKLAGEDPTGLTSSSTWKKSAEFVEKMDAVIDACNSYSSRTVDRQKRPLSDENPEIKKRLQQFIAWSEQWSINKGKPPCFVGLPLTVQALLQLHDDLNSEFPGYVLATGLCNQDSVEHTHSKLRGRGGFNSNPTARMYRLAFRHILSTDFIHTSDRANVTCQETHSLIESKKSDVMQVEQCKSGDSADNQLPEYNSQEIQELNEIIEAANVMEMYLEIDASLMPEMTSRSSYEANAITFFAGYIARKSLLKNKCDECTNDFVKNADDAKHVNEKYIQYREYPHADEKTPDVTYLTRPTEEFVKILNCHLEAFQVMHESVWHQRQLINHLTEQVEFYTSQKFPDWFCQDNICYKHRIDALQFLLLVKIYAKTREHNNINKAARKISVATKNQKLKNVQNV